MSDDQQHLAARLADARRRADTAEALAERLLRELAIVTTGEAEVTAWLDQAGRGVSVRRIAAEAGRSKSAVHRAIAAARRELAARGLLPASWRRVPQSWDARRVRRGNEPMIRA